MLAARLPRNSVQYANMWSWEGDIWLVSEAVCYSEKIIKLYLIIARMKVFSEKT